ncbi:hypothetical protein A3768_4348 (plasmid) [Ralstonia solanacearum]|nr:hypothetical protein F504_5143 [Ralstonia pseudosolanacearum FQY_4]ANH35164.1 hypothetical protein A3768_4348 [Ralstonia solanacearum]
MWHLVSVGWAGREGPAVPLQGRCPAPRMREALHCAAPAMRGNDEPARTTDRPCFLRLGCKTRHRCVTLYGVASFRGQLSG